MISSHQRYNVSDPGLILEDSSDEIRRQGSDELGSRLGQIIRAAHANDLPSVKKATTQEEWEEGTS